MRHKYYCKIHDFCEDAKSQNCFYFSNIGLQYLKIQGIASRIIFHQNIQQICAFHKYKQNFTKDNCEIGKKQNFWWHVGRWRHRSDARVECSVHHVQCMANAEFRHFIEIYTCMYLQNIIASFILLYCHTVTVYNISPNSPLYNYASAQRAGGIYVSVLSVCPSVCLSVSPWRFFSHNN